MSFKGTLKYQNGKPNPNAKDKEKEKCGFTNEELKGT
jgi:hypothetical protein